MEENTFEGRKKKAVEKAKKHIYTSTFEEDKDISIMRWLENERLKESKLQGEVKIKGIFRVYYAELVKKGIENSTVVIQFPEGDLILDVKNSRIKEVE